MKKKQAKRRKKEIGQDLWEEDSNGDFAFIAGYTSDGAPFGVTWEGTEMDEKEINRDNKSSKAIIDVDDLDLPF